jgi:predicted nucleotidyltransferase
VSGRKKTAARGRADFDAFGHDALGLLVELGLEFLLIGGVAVIARGVPRTTADVDVLIFASEARLVELLDAALAAGFTADRETELEALRTTGTLRIRRGVRQLDIIAASLPFERRALDRAKKQSFFGVSVALPTAEDLLAFKVLAGREKDLDDAVHIAARHLPNLDVARAEEAVREVAEYAEDMSLVARLHAVLRKARAAAD